MEPGDLVLAVAALIRADAHYTDLLRRLVTFSERAPKEITELEMRALTDARARRNPLEEQAYRLIDQFRQERSKT